jgi:phenylalanine ammonia-lyase
MRRSSMQLPALTLDRYDQVFPSSQDFTGNAPQVESAQTIWYLLQDSKFAQLHEEEVSFKEDQYNLRQDRYPLRTAPQFIGPQIEDILSALTAITRECNSSVHSILFFSSHF